MAFKERWNLIRRWTFRLAGMGFVLFAISFTISTAFKEFWDAVMLSEWQYRAAFVIVLVLSGGLMGSWLGDVLTAWTLPPWEVEE